MNIVEITNDDEKQNIARNILEALPEWFGIPESREEYIRDSIGQSFFCAYRDDEPVGFCVLNRQGKIQLNLP